MCSLAIGLLGLPRLVRTLIRSASAPAALRPRQKSPITLPISPTNQSMWQKSPINSLTNQSMWQKSPIPWQKSPILWRRSPMIRPNSPTKQRASQQLTEEGGQEEERGVDARMGSPTVSDGWLSEGLTLDGGRRPSGSGGGGGGGGGGGLGGGERMQRRLRVPQIYANLRQKRPADTAKETDGCANEVYVRVLICGPYMCPYMCPYLLCVLACVCPDMWQTTLRDARMRPIYAPNVRCLIRVLTCVLMCVLICVLRCVLICVLVCVLVCVLICALIRVLICTRQTCISGHEDSN